MSIPLVQRHWAGFFAGLCGCDGLDHVGAVQVEGGDEALRDCMCALLSECCLPLGLLTDSSRLQLDRFLGDDVAQFCFSHSLKPSKIGILVVNITVHSRLLCTPPIGSDKDCLLDRSVT